MIFLRIKRRARQRLSEWFAAAVMLGFGTTLLAPGDTFTSPSYAAFDAMFPESLFGMVPEQQLGILIATTGALWLAGLIVNGAKQRATMHIRAVCGLIGGIIFGCLAIGFALPFLAFIWTLTWWEALLFMVGRIDPPNAVYLSTGVSHYLLDSILCFATIYYGLTETHDERH